MNKIKVIDLLNMISKGEEVPKKIKYDGIIYYKKRNVYKHTNYYESENNNLLIANIQNSIQLNDEVAILEEEKKLPEKIDLTGYWDKNSLRTEEWCFSEELICVKINEILDYLESKEKGE